VVAAGACPLPRPRPPPLTPALRPDWVPALQAVLGADIAVRVQADPAWPGLVAAVTTAAADGWTPEQALTTAAELLLAGQDDDSGPRPDELATALTWRIGLLTEHQPTADQHVSPRDEDAHPTTPPPPDPKTISIIATTRATTA
jgi:hypothetical protein